MATKTRLDKAINGLNEIVDRNNKQDKFIFSNEKVIINRDTSSQFGAILLMSLILLIPIGIILYYVNCGQCKLKYILVAFVKDIICYFGMGKKF